MTMGYWTQNEEGASFTDADNGQEMVWGDSPADVVDNALWEIRALFIKDVGRLPTKAEVMAGLTFSTRAGLDDLPASVEEAEAMADGVMPDVDADAFGSAYYTATFGDVAIPANVLAARDAVNSVITRLAKSP